MLAQVWRGPCHLIWTLCPLASASAAACERIKPVVDQYYWFPVGHLFDNMTGKEARKKKKKLNVSYFHH